MKAFEWVSPTSVEEAVKLLSNDGQQRDRVKLLAGGQDLLTEMKEHLVEPDTLVNLKRISGLASIAFDAGGSLSIGALTTIAALAEHARVRRDFRVLAEAAESIASPQIRSQGTVGGNLCQRPRCWYYRHEHSPCLKKGGTECFSFEGQNKYNAILGGGPSYIVHPSDLAPALVALEAEVTLAGPKGERTLALEKFFTLPSQGDVLRENVLAPNEILVRVRVPARSPDWKSTYLKFKERGSYDFALSAVAAAVAIKGGTISAARLCLGGVAPVPWHAASAEKKLVGKPNELATWKAAAEEALRGAEPLARNGYKVPLTQNLIVRALESLAR